MEVHFTNHPGSFGAPTIPQKFDQYVYTQEQQKKKFCSESEMLTQAQLKVIERMVSGAEIIFLLTVVQTINSLAALKKFPEVAQEMVLVDFIEEVLNMQLRSPDLVPQFLMQCWQQSS